MVLKTLYGAIKETIIIEGVKEVNKWGETETIIFGRRSYDVTGQALMILSCFLSDMAKVVVATGITEDGGNSGGNRGGRPEPTGGAAMAAE